MGLTALDILVLIALGGGGVLGTIRGFVAEVLALGAWVAAILAVKLFHAPLAGMLEGPVGTTAGASVLAFVIAFGTVFIAGKLIAASIGRRTRSSVLGPIDRALGFGFGALKGLIGVTLLFLVANMLIDAVYGGASERPAWMTESRSFPLLNATSRAIVDWYATRRSEGHEEPSETNAS